MYNLDITKTRVNAIEFAHGGYVQVQKALGKAINENQRNIQGPTRMPTP